MTKIILFVDLLNYPDDGQLLPPELLSCVAVAIKFQTPALDTSSMQVPYLTNHRPPLSLSEQDG